MEHGVVRKLSSQQDTQQSESSAKRLSLLESLPKGLDVGLGSFLSTGDIYRLRCVSRGFAPYTSHVKRLSYVNEERFKSLLALWEGGVTSQLEYLHFDESVVWESDHSALVDRFKRVLAAQGLQLTIRHLDLSSTYPRTRDLCELIQALGSSCVGLHVLHLPDLSDLSVRRIASHLEEMLCLSESQLPLRMPRANEAQVVERGGGRSAVLRAYEGSEVFSRRLTSYSANWVSGDEMLQGSSSFWVPSGLRTLMLEAHGTALEVSVMVGVVKEVWGRGHLANLEQLTLFVARPSASHPSVMHQALVWHHDPPRPTNIRVLRVRGLCVGFEAGCQLADALTPFYFPHLTELDLSDNLLTDIGLSRLCSRVVDGFGRSLTNLNLAMNHAHMRRLQTSLTPDGLHDLCQALLPPLSSPSPSPSPAPPMPLRILCLSGQALGDAGMDQLSETMAQGGLDLLEALEVRDNGVTEVGLSSLLHGLASRFAAAGSVKKPTVMKRLDLERNRVNGDGVDLSFPHGPCPIDSLNLGRNTISPSAVAALLGSGAGVGMRELVLGGGDMDDRGVLAEIVRAGERGFLPDVRLLDLLRVEADGPVLDRFAALILGDAWPRLCRLRLCVPRGLCQVLETGLRGAQEGRRVWWDVLELHAAPKPR